ncbi:MAG: T9SS type A sorting domain-containing protein [candidate division FCPU426 bacterium]
MKPFIWAGLLAAWLMQPHSAAALTPAFHIAVNGEESNTVTVEAAPNTFAVYVTVRDEDTGFLLNANVAFVLEAFQADLSGPGLGTLQINFGATINGECLIYNQYTQAENIRIRVRDASGLGTPLPAYSAELQVFPSAPANSLMWADPPAQNMGGFIYAVPSNVTALVKVMILDANNNPIAGLPVDFAILAAPVGSTLAAAGSNTTDATGLAAAWLQTGLLSESFDLQAAAGSLTPALHIGVFVPTATPTITPTATMTPTSTATPAATSVLALTATATPTPTSTPTPANPAQGIGAYPNPAAGIVHFTWTGQADRVRILVYNPAGERVAEVRSEPGANSARWDVGGMASGVYLYQIIFDRNGSTTRTSTRKIAIVRH